MTQENVTWVDELNSQISEILSDNKTMKFNTHKNRKQLISKIQGLITESINKNVPPEHKQGTKEALGITKLKQDHVPKGFVVHKESESVRGDEISQQAWNKKEKRRGLVIYI